eukprot:357533-Chlamydomonas_euryale.AAC.1
MSQSLSHSAPLAHASAASSGGTAAMRTTSARPGTTPSISCSTTGMSAPDSGSALALMSACSAATGTAKKHVVAMNAAHAV